MALGGSVMGSHDREGRGFWSESAVGAAGVVPLLVWRQRSWTGEVC